MTFKEYKQLTTRTLPDLGSLVLNSVHMTMGFASETYELFEAITKEDVTNIGEEIGDKLWYTANYINVNELDVEFEFSTKKLQIYSTNGGEDLSGFTMIEIESELLDYDKKFLAYGKERDKTKMTTLVGRLLASYNNFILSQNLDASQIMSRNIAKLLVRFPDKFTQEDANHRDLVREREILEGK